MTAVTATVPTPDDARWTAVANRDSTASSFVYAVRTTGIYCRPGCPSRRPHRHNVTFYDNAAEAAAAGYTPCKRCRPDAKAPSERQAALVEAACRRIEQAEDMPQLAELAAEADLSPHHFHRLFKTVTGVTPKAYAAAEREKRLRAALSESASVTEAIYAAGFNSPSRFHAAAQTLGMTPQEYRAGGRDAVVRFALGQCSLGSILVAASDRGICAIALGDDPAQLLHDLENGFPAATLIGGDAGFEDWVAQVVGFVDDPRQGLALPLDIRGTAFQQRVWQALTAIPPGETVTYSDLAARIGRPAAVRAVARACAANTLAVAIPCHRVIRTDGALGGYRWGLTRKETLLQRERAP